MTKLHEELSAVLFEWILVLLIFWYMLLFFSLFLYKEDLMYGFILYLYLDTNELFTPA